MIVTTVLFVFPPELPVTGSNMNYCIVAFAIIVIVSVVQWVVDGRKNYRGPQVELVGDPNNHENGGLGGAGGMEGKEDMERNGYGEMDGNGRRRNSKLDCGG